MLARTMQKQRRNQAGSSARIALAIISFCRVAAKNMKQLEAFCAGEMCTGEKGKIPLFSRFYSMFTKSDTPVSSSTSITAGDTFFMITVSPRFFRSL